MSNMSLSDSDLSSLSSAPPSDDESAPMAVDEPVGITKYFKKESESPPPKRAPSPPHEYVLADNPDIALRLLKSLILWSLSSSEAIQAKIKESYKQARHEDDLNQPLSVQPWGRDGLKRRYWLVEGLDDTHFRLYRESNPALKNVTWWSVAGTIPELKAVADKLDEEKSTHSKKLSEKIKNSVPRFEGSEEKRKRRDYRIARKAQFSRPEPGFSLYEGRTRGKKLKYTYSDDEDIFSDGLPSTRRSTRNTSGISSPAEPVGPRFTASGRQIRSRAGGMYGESLLSGQRDEPADAEDSGRPQRTRSTRANGYTGYNVDDELDESDEGHSSGKEWQGGEEEEDNDFEGDDEEELSGDESIVNGENPSLVVQLRYGKGKVPSSPNGPSDMLSGGSVGNKLEIAIEPAPPEYIPSSDATKPTVSTIGEDGPQGQKTDLRNEANGQPEGGAEAARVTMSTGSHPCQPAPAAGSNEGVQSI
ncbi:hypothetical protein APSETT444_009989 [Aspergillus pseudonomiae]